jgi:protein-L-isoaspartate(D-aspartate) O-methyltransferase
MKSTLKIMLATSVACFSAMALGAPDPETNAVPANSNGPVLFRSATRTPFGEKSGQPALPAETAAPVAGQPEAAGLSGRSQPTPGQVERPPVPSVVLAPVQQRPAAGDRGYRLKRPQQDLAFDAARARMVTNQLATSGAVTTQKVLDAMAAVPRHQFVPSEFLADSYENRSLDIGFDRNLESPFVVALLAQQLDSKPSDRVLEIGTASGYQTAVLSHLVKEVYSIEPVETLARGAQLNFQRLGYTNNVFVRSGATDAGWPEAAPFDVIVVNNDSNGSISAALLDQVKEGGRVIIPVNKEGSQEVLLKSGGQLGRQSTRPARLAAASENKVSGYPKVPVTKEERPK